jgi:hypothetical protein
MFMLTRLLRRHPVLILLACVAAFLWIREPSGAQLPPARNGQHAATDVLASLPVRSEHRTGYNRELFPHWTTTSNGCDTRRAVLIAETRTPVTVDPATCWITGGSWTSLYDNVTTSRIGDLEVDHTVALVEAWDSGAWNWTAARRTAYANDLSDPRTLRAITVDANQTKSGNDISGWAPRRHLCRYVADTLAIKARWGLSIDRTEARTYTKLLTTRCTGLTIRTWPPAP